jgi:hypothetical protein
MTKKIIKEIDQLRLCGIGVRIEQFICKSCGKPFDTYTELYHHVEEEHNR